MCIETAIKDQEFIRKYVEPPLFLALLVLASSLSHSCSDTKVEDCDDAPPAAFVVSSDSNNLLMPGI